MTDDEVRHALQKSYVLADEAFEAKDIGHIADLMSPNFEGTGPDGTHATRDRVLANVGKQFEEFESVSFPRTITSLTVNGDTATAVTQGTYRAVGEDGKPVEQQLRNVDVWEKGPAGRVMVRSRALNVSASK